MTALFQYRFSYMFRSNFCRFANNHRRKKFEENILRKGVSKPTIEYSAKSEYDQVLKWNVPCKPHKNFAKYFRHGKMNLFQDGNREHWFVWSFFLVLHRFHWTKSNQRESLDIFQPKLNHILWQLFVDLLFLSIRCGRFDWKTLRLSIFDLYLTFTYVSLDSLELKIVW